MPQDDQDTASVSMQEMQNIQLPPMFEQFIKLLQQDRKKLLRDKAFAQPEQLRTYIGHYLFTRLEEMVRLLTTMSIEAYTLAASNTNEIRRLHAFTVEELNQLGAGLREDDIDLPGVSVEVLNDFQAAFYALGTVLQKKYPDDKETQEAYNRVAATVGEMVEDLMSGYDEDDDDDRDEDDDDDRDEDDSDDDDSDDDDSDDEMTDVDEEELLQEAQKKSETAEESASDGSEGDDNG